MQTCAKEGTCLADLVELASRTCQLAERDHPRRGRGRKPVYEDWLIAVLIVVAIAKMKKSKDAQFKFIQEHQQSLSQLLRSPLPSRTTYYDRYPRAWRLYQTAIQRQGRQAIRGGWADATVVAVDKSLIAARGPVGHVRRSRRRGTDHEATWGRSEHDGWVFGFGYEVVVSCGKNGLICPLLASADTASRHESVSFREQIPRLPRRTKYVLADRAFDNDDACEAIEWRHGKRTGRRFVCHTRRSARPQARRVWRRTAHRLIRHQHRLQRKAFLQTARGKRLYRRRGTSVEPFNAWLKTLFQLEDRVWHRGLDNNRTQLLAGIFIYQLLLTINRRRGHKNGRIKWLLDAL
jgi:hypothetical protein